MHIFAPQSQPSFKWAWVLTLHLREELAQETSYRCLFADGKAKQWTGEQALQQVLLFNLGMLPRCILFLKMLGAHGAELVWVGL